MDEAPSRLKIAFLTAEAMHDRQSLSGSMYYMAQALEHYCGDVTPVDELCSLRRRVLGWLVRKASKYHIGWHLAYKRLLLVARKQSRMSTQRLAGQHFDVIVAPNGAPEIAFLQTEIPVLFVSDITFSLQRNARHDYEHPDYSHLLPFSVRQGEFVEAAAFQKAARLLFSSPWAARSAREDYGIDASKVHALLWGANLDAVPPIKQLRSKKPGSRCTLLFMSKGWERKGGAIALETLQALLKLGIEAELIICGCLPPADLSHPRMSAMPFLDKSDQAQVSKLADIYTRATFLLLPTRVDCVPNVISEANAFGIPVITTDTGGVAGAIWPGENGYALPYTARGDAYARLIAEIYGDEQRYQQMVLASRAIFEQHLNWEVWGKAVRALLEDLLADQVRQFPTPPVLSWAEARSSL